jgi:hypothetical protein
MATGDEHRSIELDHTDPESNRAPSLGGPLWDKRYKRQDGTPQPRPVIYTYPDGTQIMAGDFVRYHWGAGCIVDDTLVTTLPPHGPDCVCHLEKAEDIFDGGPLWLVSKNSKGKLVLFYQGRGDHQHGIWAVDPAQEGDPVRLVFTPNPEHAGTIILPPSEPAEGSPIEWIQRAEYALHGPARVVGVDWGVDLAMREPVVHPERGGGVRCQCSLTPYEQPLRWPQRFDLWWHDNFTEVLYGIFAGFVITMTAFARTVITTVRTMPIMIDDIYHDERSRTRADRMIADPRYVPRVVQWSRPRWGVWELAIMCLLNSLFFVTSFMIASTWLSVLVLLGVAAFDFWYLVIEGNK